MLVNAEPKTEINRPMTDTFIIYKNLIVRRLASDHLKRKYKPMFFSIF